MVSEQNITVLTQDHLDNDPHLRPILFLPLQAKFLTI